MPMYSLATMARRRGLSLALALFLLLPSAMLATAGMRATAKCPMTCSASCPMMRGMKGHATGGERMSCCCQCTPQPPAVVAVSNPLFPPMTPVQQARPLASYGLADGLRATALAGHEPRLDHPPSMLPIAA